MIGFRQIMFLSRVTDGYKHHGKKRYGSRASFLSLPVVRNVGPPHPPDSFGGFNRLAIPYLRYG